MNLSYKIPSFKFDENPALGNYAPADGELGDQLNEILDALKAGSTANFEVPRIESYSCSGEMIGDSYRITVTSRRHPDGHMHDLPIPVCTTYFAVTDEDVPGLCNDVIAS